MPRVYHQLIKVESELLQTNMKDRITGAKALMRALQAEGVKTIFGYPGGSIMPVYDALFDYTRGEKKCFDHILVRHEQGATHAAEGYARVSGEVGVALVTSGPGVTNTLTGIADAMLDSTPIVVIAGQVRRSLSRNGVIRSVVPRMWHGLSVVLSILPVQGAQVPWCSTLRRMPRQRRSTGNLRR